MNGIDLATIGHSIRPGKQMNSRSKPVESSHRRDQADVFAVLWAVTHLAHMVRKGDPGNFATWLVVFAGLWLLHRPSDGVRLGILASTQLVYLIPELPDPDNHLIIYGVVNLGLLASLFRSGWARSYRDARPDEAFPFIRVALLIAYGAAAVAKLNSGFFDEEVSCAIWMLHEHFSVVDESAIWHIPMSEWLIPSGIAAVELSIPLLLLFQRTRVIGVVVLVPFHILITITPSSPGIGFTIGLFALVFFFLPLDVGTRLKQSYESLTSLFSDPTGRAFFLMMVGVALSLAIDRLGFQFGSYPESRNWVWLAISALTIGALLLDGARRARGEHVSLKIKHFVYWVLILIVVLNAASPYLGGKTLASFTMYSNLQTERQTSNHFFIPRLPVETSQDDLVRIEESSHPGLHRVGQRNEMLTWHELRRILADNPETKISFRRDGVLYELERADEMPELVTTDPVKHWLIAHRTYTPKSPVCLW